MRIGPGERLDRLQSAFGDRLIRRELPGAPFPQPPHATLTEDSNHPARRVFDEVVNSLNARLM